MSTYIVCLRLNISIFRCTWADCNANAHVCLYVCVTYCCIKKYKIAGHGFYLKGILRWTIVSEKWTRGGTHRLCRRVMLFCGLNYKLDKPMNNVFKFLARIMKCIGQIEQPQSRLQFVVWQSQVRNLSLGFVEFKQLYSVHCTMYILVVSVCAPLKCPNTSYNLCRTVLYDTP